MKGKKISYVWLSHTLSNTTPLYGGEKDGIRIDADKSIDHGDSCNTSRMRLPSHAGTHIDAPLHFVADGRSIESYEPEDWIFNRPAVVHLEANAGMIIQPEDIVATLPEETDICLFKTGFEAWRGDDLYWKKAPGIAPETAAFLIERCPDLRTIGMDFISISSLSAREIGRQAHRAFLEKGILIIEDMRLSAVGEETCLEQVICLPLRCTGGDGAPCSVIGSFGSSH